MGINFNIVKKPKVEEDDGEELEEELEEEEVKNKGYDPKKKMLRFMAIIVAVMIVVLIILFLVSSLGNRKSNTYSYSQIENILEKAAKSYFKDNDGMLPQEENYTVEVDDDDLVAAGKMKSLSSYPTKGGVVCTGSVSVQLEDDDYVYSPILNCGDNYATVSLASKVISKNEIVTSGDGLYSRNGEYIFRGENVNNYVQLDNNLWRIVKITSDNEIVLITEYGVGYTHSWDNRYNEQKKYDAGINNYDVSRVKDFLDDVYKNSATSKTKDKYLLSKKDKTKLVTYDLCIGKRNTKSEDKKNTEECKQTLKDQKLGLLTLSDYLYASVDPNCKSIETKSCKNYNYLINGKSWWLVTANSENTYGVYVIKVGGTVKSDYASNFAYVRPVVHLNSNVLFKSGKGTEDKPYKVR